MHGDGRRSRTIRLILAGVLVLPFSLARGHPSEPLQEAPGAASRADGPAGQHVQAAEAACERLGDVTASAVDPSLPDVPLDAWLHGVLPRAAALTCETNDCGEQTGDPAIDAARDLPRCLDVMADVISRARRMELLLRGEDLRFRTGAVLSDELEGRIVLRKLSDLEAALKRPLRPYPLTCPEGTTLQIEEQHAGVKEWCEDAMGRKHGPYRAWFSTGIYLMRRGRYVDDARVGTWTECSRFESCVEKTE